MFLSRGKKHLIGGKHYFFTHLIVLLTIHHITTTGMFMTKLLKPIIMLHLVKDTPDISFYLEAEMLMQEISNFTIS